MSLNQQEKAQYARHLVLPEIGEVGQLKLKQAKVLVIGAGGLGCPILQYLVAAGVGTIGIVDGDSVSISNLQRQILFTHADVGKNKAETAKTRLKQLNPNIHIQAYSEFLSKENALELFAKYDIVVDGSDNFATRYLLNDAAVITNKPLVFGSIFKFDGQVSVFNYQNGPTYRCIYPEPPIAGEMPNCSEVGVLGVLPGLIGCLQANEVIKIICGTGEVLSGKLLLLDALTLQQTILEVVRTEHAVVNELQAEYHVPCAVSQEVSLEWMQQHHPDFLLVDVRELHEREAFNIGGEHVPLSEIPNWTPATKPILLYCQSGMRSNQAVEWLQQEYPKGQFFSLEGGVNRLS